jgi:hypothetical protein
MYLLYSISIKMLVFILYPGWQKGSLMQKRQQKRKSAGKPGINMRAIHWRKTPETKSAAKDLAGQKAII